MLTDTPIIPGSNTSAALERSLTFYPAGDLKLYDNPIVLVHGWGADSQIWQDFPVALNLYADVYTIDLPGFGNSPSIEEYSEQSIVDWLYQQLPQPCYLIGLSLGGMLCRAFAASYPETVLGLVTLCANLKFVADKQYQMAMPESDFKNFSALWDQDPLVCLAKFSGLQSQGDHKQRQLIRQLRAMTSLIDPHAGQSMLALLAQIDGSDQLTHIKCPSLAIFGEQDCLVPVTASTQLPHSHDVFVVDAASHLPHLSCESKVVDRIHSFIGQAKYQLDKDRVAKSFSRAAKTYDSAAHIQQWSGNHLINSLDVNHNIAAIVDLGCGTGTQSFLLNNRYPKAQITGVDFSPQMLEYARNQQHENDINWLCCDVEDLLLESHSMDLVFSNFALQWSNDPLPSLREIYRVMNSEGRFHFAIPGPRTLWELRKIWADIDKDIHINRFLSVGQWQLALEASGFTHIQLSNVTKMDYHASAKDLLWSLKAVGATNHNRGKSKHLTGKSHIKRLYDAYQQYVTSEGTYPVTWDIIFGSAVK